VRRDGERLADIIEAAEKISIRAGRGRHAFDADEDVQIQYRPHLIDGRLTATGLTIEP
jgi:hypothetical protein